MSGIVRDKFAVGRMLAVARMQRALDNAIAAAAQVAAHAAVCGGDTASEKASLPRRRRHEWSNQEQQHKWSNQEQQQQQQQQHKKHRLFEPMSDGRQALPQDAQQPCAASTSHKRAAPAPVGDELENVAHVNKRRL